MNAEQIVIENLEKIRAIKADTNKIIAVLKSLYKQLCQKEVTDTAKQREVKEYLRKMSHRRVDHIEILQFSLLSGDILQFLLQDEQEQCVQEWYAVFNAELTGSGVILNNFRFFHLNNLWDKDIICTGTKELIKETEPLATFLNKYF